MLQDFITLSFRFLGGLASGYEPDGTMAADALATFNYMLDSWQTKRLTIYAQSRTSHVLTQYVSRYTIGSGGTFTEARPLWIDAIKLSYGGLEYPLELYSRDKFARIMDKTLRGSPEGALYLPDYPLGTFDVWPVPDLATYSLVIYAPAASLTSVASLNTALSLPPGWAGALRYNLAVELAAEYDETPNAIVVQGAVSKKADIKRTNEDRDEMRVDAALLGGQSLDRRTGSIRNPW